MNNDVEQYEIFKRAIEVEKKQRIVISQANISDGQEPFFKRYVAQAGYRLEANGGLWVATRK